MVSPTISSPVCQEQLVEAGKLVDRSVESCVKACLSATDDSEHLKQVGAAANTVSQALSDLLQHVRHYASCGEPIGRYDQATDTIMTVTESIFTSMGDAGELWERRGGERRMKLGGERQLKWKGEASGSELFGRWGENFSLLINLASIFTFLASFGIQQFESQTIS